MWAFLEFSVCYLQRFTVHVTVMDFRWLFHTSALGQSPVCERYYEFEWKEATGRHLSHCSDWFGSVWPDLDLLRTWGAFGKSAETEEMREWIDLVISLLECVCVLVSPYVLFQACFCYCVFMSVCQILCVCLCSDLCFTVQQHDWHPLQSSKNSAPLEREMCHFIRFLSKT